MTHRSLLFVAFSITGLLSSAQTTTLHLQPGPDEGQDALLHGLDSEVDHNWGGIDQLPAMAWTFQGVPGVVRSALAFDLGAVPPGAQVLSASLTLHATDRTDGFGQHSELSGSNACWLRRITSPWNASTVTWNTQPATTTLHQLALPELPEVDDDLTADVTQLVQDMVDDPANSHGFELLLQTEEYYRKADFAASEHADPALRPELTLTYRVPVPADSCFTLRAEGLSGQDAVLHGLVTEVDHNWGHATQLAATAWTFQGVPGTVRCVLEFDLTHVPPDATILSASLSLFAYAQEDGFGPHSTLSGSNAAWLRRVTSPWDEDLVTWNTQPGTTADHQVALPASTAPDEDYLDINVTQLVQDMVDDPLHGHGFELRLQTEEYYRKLNFWSGECPQPSKRPRLDVCYARAAGVASVAPAAPALQVYPNPAGDRVTIAPPAGAVVDILDAQGRMVRTFRASLAPFQVEGLPAGTYVVRATLREGMATARLVVTP